MKYGKFLAQVGATVLAALVPLLAGNHDIGPSEVVNIVLVALGAVAVLGAGNLPAGVWAHAKAIVAAATAVAVLLQSVITDGISAAEWFQLALAALGAVGVFAAPGPVVYADPLAAGSAGAGLRSGPA